MTFALVGNQNCGKTTLFNQLTGASLPELGSTLHTLFSTATAFSFLVFTLLYTPCVAAISAVRRELGSLKGTLFIVLYQTGLAWLAAFFIFRIGRLLG